MRALLDTCVISEVCRPNGDPRVRARVAALRSEDSYLSVLSIGEIVRGIELLPPGGKRSMLERFLQSVERDFDERVLPIDGEIARIWGETTARARSRGRTIPPTDGLIAATAIQNGLHIMTRNVSDFAETGAMLINPWEGE